MSVALFPGLVFAKMLDPTDMDDRSDATHRVMGAVGGTTMRTFWLSVKVTVSVRPTAPLSLATTVPLVMVVSVSLAVSAEMLRKHMHANGKSGGPLPLVREFMFCWHRRRLFHTAPSSGPRIAALRAETCRQNKRYDRLPPASCLLVVNGLCS
jgi:hypothetical protein